MKHKLSSNVSLLGTLISLASVCGLIMTLLVINASIVEATTSNPAFNKGRRGGGAFIITKPDGTKVGNVAGHNNVFEQNFVRVGSHWDMYGNYSNGGNALEVCEEQTVYIWVYAHNTIASKNNHSDKKTTGKLDFKGNAVAKNTTAAVNIATLDRAVYQNRHTVTGTVNADNAQAVSDQAVIYCDSQEIAISSKNVAAPTVQTWANVATYDNQTTKNTKAVAAFGSQYGISKSDKIFSSGALIGYNGNLPSCRYYAAYVQVAVKVELKKTPVPDDPVVTTTTETPVEVTDTGSVGLGNSWMLFAISVTTATFVATYLRFAYARRRQ